MIFSSDRGELRRMYREAWHKSRAGLPVSPLEAQIAAVIARHPEYHASIETGDLESDYHPEGGRTNPYLHMGLHLGLAEQVATDRPAGIREIHRRLTTSGTDPHDAEHRMMECLAETLWEAQAGSRAPDEVAYVARLRRLAGTVPRE